MVPGELDLGLIDGGKGSAYVQPGGVVKRTARLSGGAVSGSESDDDQGDDGGKIPLTVRKGVLMLKFEHHVWPFEDSRTPPGQQN